ncbi:transmembrane protein 151B [Seminavis robusta]|uniref:Transmembrane protein 151B n=1 Tax=Seminavis robusta TaxID=568900 RepID=A0A9N8HS42_9STRA|nr:transmembrane protein 151B [Seminavis robusta]|eukprot:Sro1343_g264610.1 transmembrane protein 151B (503) ;mRNA; f:12686-14194
MEPEAPLYNESSVISAASGGAAPSSPRGENHHGDYNHHNNSPHNVFEVLAPRRTEEDEYLDYQNQGTNEEPEAPWMQGTVIQIDESPPPPPQHAPPNSSQEESVIDETTFIKADTFIQSNDPKAKDKTNEDDTAPQQTQQLQKGGDLRHLMLGCIRDRHVTHSILYLGIVCFLLAWWIQAIRWRRNDCDRIRSYRLDDYPECSEFFGHENYTFLRWFIFVFGYVFFLGEFWFSSTGKYLKNIHSNEDLHQYLKRMYATAPTLSITIECYHYETRVVHYTDSNGNSCTRTETYPVVTYVETEPIHIQSWEDQSVPLDPKLIQFEVTKVRMHKTYTGDANLAAKSEDLIRRNRYRDLYYNFRTNYGIEGFKERLLAFVDLSKKPSMLNYPACLISHLLIFPALPYRLWLSAITGKLDATIHKRVETGDSPAMPGQPARSLQSSQSLDQPSEHPDVELGQPKPNNHRSSSNMTPVQAVPVPVVPAAPVPGATMSENHEDGSVLYA